MEKEEKIDVIKKERKSKIYIVWISFIIYLGLFLFGCATFENKQYTWLFLNLYSLILDIILLIKYKFPKKKSILLAVGLSGIYILSEITRFNPMSVIHMVLVFLSTCAVTSVFNKEKEDALCWIKSNRKKDILITILLGLIFGIVWGGINYLLMKGSNEIKSANVLQAFLLSLSPATIEEISCRTVFYAFCLSLVHGKFTTKWQKFTFWFMMMIPHILPHTTECFSNGILNGLISWIIITMLYVLVFGLVFAVLQKKRDITSAMIAHGVVDFIRFCIFGLPV